MLLSAFSFSVMAVCVKQLEGRIPVAEVVFARSVVSLGISWWLIQRMGLNPWGKKRLMLVLRGIVGTLALFCVYAALAELPLAAATVFQYLYPTFTTALAWGILGEITSIAYVTVRSLAEYENPMVIVFYFPLVSLPMSLPLLVLNPVLPSGSDWAWLIGVGIFTQLGQIWLTQGLTQMPATRATAISYAQVVFAATWGVLFFGEILNISTIIGAALVLGATILSLKMK